MAKSGERSTSREAVAATLTLRNAGQAEATITGVGTRHEPRSNEPFPRDDALAPGEAITYEAGAAADGNVLTRQFVFDDDRIGVDEGAEVLTAAGERFTQLC